MSNLRYYGTLALSLSPLVWTMCHGQPIAGEAFLPFCWTAYAMYDAIKSISNGSQKED